MVFDPVGCQAGRAAFKATAFEGKFIVIGYASGERARVDDPALCLYLFDLYRGYI